MPLGRVAAQTSGKALAFNALTINDGLSQGMVTSILQDRYGFMWFATLDGVNRYDGYHFVVYRHDAHDPASITESYVQALFEDSKGRLWIGTVSGGLDLFDRETETFIHLTRQEGNANSLSQGPINSISEDEHGNIWVHVSDKLDKITINKGKAFNNDFSIHHIKVPFHSEVSFLSIIKTGVIYYANAEDGVIYKLDDERTETWSVAFNLHEYFQHQNKNPAPFYRLVQLLEDKAQGKFYIFHEGGVIRLDEKTGAPEKVYQNTFFKNYYPPIPPSLDRDGIAWFPRANNLSFFDTHSGQISNATAKNPDISRSVKHTYSTFIDRSGLLWVGTSGYGIIKRNILSEKFHHTSTLYTYSIKEAGDDKIILGNSESTEEVFDRTKGESIASTRGKKPKNDTTYSANFLISPADIDKSLAWFAESNKLYCRDKALKKNHLLPFTRCR